jgi:transglutaminase-like putative cysteine protease
MPEYQITYYTHNIYSGEMKQALLEFLILPANTETQERLSYNLETWPGGKEHTAPNVFGFDTLQFRLQKGQADFKLSLQSKVYIKEFDPYGFVFLPYEDEMALYLSEDLLIDCFPFGQCTRLTALPDRYPHPVKKNGERVFDYIQRVNHFVHASIAYKNVESNLPQTTQETIGLGNGVCQDFAHLMLAILRAQKIPCRYVSGYLDPGEHIIGAAAIHAWVQAMVPGVGWIGFDPTNNLLEDHHYIKIAHGVDLDDCQNVKGVVLGAGNNKTSYSVKVFEQNKNQNQ